MKVNVSFADAFKKCGVTIDWKMNDIEMLYNANYLNHDGSGAQRIPKIIHHIWMGSPVPEKYQYLIDIWKENHPTWEMKLWDEAAVEKFGLTNYDLYKRIKNWSSKSDIVRTEVLHRFGGVYSDTDFLSVKPTDDLLYLKFFAGYGPSERPIDVFPGVIGACPNNEMLGNIINKMKTISYTPMTIGEIMECGPTLFAKTILEELDPELTVLFPPSFFYSFPGLLREEIRNIPTNRLWDVMWKFTYPETYAIHLYHCSWQKQAMSQA